jgi:hypothetical protein
MEKTAVQTAVEWRLEKLGMDKKAFGDLANTLIGGGLGMAGGYAAGHFMGDANETPEARAARARKYAMGGGMLGAGAGYFSGYGQSAPGQGGPGVIGAAKGASNTVGGGYKLGRDMLKWNPMTSGYYWGARAIPHVAGAVNSGLQTYNNISP